MLLNLDVKPKSNQEKMVWDKEKHILYVWTRSVPENGKANEKIIKKLKKLFRYKVSIVKGNKSHHKVVEIEFDRKKKEIDKEDENIDAEINKILNRLVNESK